MTARKSRKSENLCFCGGAPKAKRRSPSANLSFSGTDVVRRLSSADRDLAEALAALMHRRGDPVADLAITFINVVRGKVHDVVRNTD